MFYCDYYFFGKLKFQMFQIFKYTINFHTFLNVSFSNGYLNIWSTHQNKNKYHKS